MRALGLGGINMAANPGFPLSLDVKGYPVLVLGGDEEAAEKTQRLLEAGAKVTVVAPALHATLKDMAASAKVVHRGRHFRDADLDSAILVLNMVRGDRDFSRALFAKAREKKVLLWSVDQPEASTATMPAVVACGHLRVAISTSGVAPALSGFMKEDMEKIFGEEFAAFVDWLGQLRERTKASEPDFEKRRALLREALDGFRLLGKVQYPKVWLDERAAKT
jgi:precorrin-2 dehydrogenase/sirohydrochlorin ferrochelatase